MQNHPSIGDALEHNARMAAGQQRPAALDRLLDHVAAQLPDTDTRRRVLTDDEYDAVDQAARRAQADDDVRAFTHDSVVIAVLAAVGILTPPPEPDTNTCTALWPDPDGEWWQCADEPGHDPTDRHNAGDWVWLSDHPDAIAPREQR